MQRVWVVVVVCALLVPFSLAGSTYVDAAQSIAVDPARGVDDLVDYPSLVLIGPWDDRNYELTLADLALLPADERENSVPLPAFFRVELRKAFADLDMNEGSRYPLSALNVFLQNFGGYLINGKYYRGATNDASRYYVLLDQGEPSPEKSAGAKAETDFVSGDVRVTSPVGAAESAIAINPTNTSQVIAGSNGPRGSQRMHYSTDGGASWHQTELPLGGACCDPTVEWSSDGRFAYTATLGCALFLCDVWFYRSDDGGVTWNSLEDVTPGDPRREVASSADREFLHVDRYPSSPFKDRIYLVYHRRNILQIARSSDFGNTWATLAFSGTSDERGIAGDVATDKNGVVYYAWPAFRSRTIRLRKSTNGGVSFGPTKVVANTNASFSYPIPAMETRKVAVYVAADVDLSNGPFANSLYLAWIDATGPTSGTASTNHSHIQVGYSRDGGETWAFSTPHETNDANNVDRWQTFLRVGNDGTVHVIFNDTRRSADRSGADVFYSYSTDGAVTWSTPRRVTSEMSPNINGGFEYGDYSGMDIVMNDLIAIFTDNRNESGGVGDSVDVYAAGIEPGGASGANPGRIPGDRNVSGTPLLVSKSGSDIKLDWSPVCGAGNDYAVYEGLITDPENKTSRTCSTGGATTTTLTPSGGQRFYLVVATGGGKEGSYGLSSANVERSPASTPCLPQAIGPCP